MLLPLKKPRAGKLDIALLFAFHVVRAPTTINTRANKLNFSHQQPALMSARSHRLTGPSSKKQKKNVKSFTCRSCLPMNKRVEIIHFAAKNPSFGYRKIASAFSVGRTQVQSIIKKKEETLTAYQSNLSKGQKQKRQRTGKFSDVNQALWDWYTLCRSSNIPVSEAIFQLSEALTIAEKLGIEGFAASNGWLESFKKTQNIRTMSVAGEEGDVSSMIH